MFNIFEKIRESIFGERTPIELGDKILKNKKLTDNEKLSAIIDAYGHYYKFKHENEVDLATWELHYEDFMIDEKYKHQLRFEKYYKMCEEDINYANIVSITRQLDALKNVDYAKCKKTELEIVKATIGLKATYDDNFDYEGFYYNGELRNGVSQKNKTVVDLIIEDYDAKHPAKEEVKKVKEDDDGRDM